MKEEMRFLLGKGCLLLLCLCFLGLGNLSVSAEMRFQDVKGKEWYAKDVLALAENKNEIIKGFPDGTFRGSSKLGVDQFITMLVRAAGERAENHSQYWAIGYLNKAKELGILQDGDFADYKAQITREQMALLILRYLARSMDVSQISMETVEKSISDFKMVGVYEEKYEKTLAYQEAVKKAYALGILTGYEDTRFLPQGILSRAEASAVVMRLLDSSRRVKYDAEAIRQKQQKEMEAHYYGGSKWVDPTNENIPKLTRALEDRFLTQGELDYVPYIHMIAQENKYPDGSVDEIWGTIYYDEKGPLPGQVEDFERLLLRRLPKSEVTKVIQYLRKKTINSSHLDHPGTDFFLDNNRYIVRLEETIGVSGNSYTIGFNIWYLDAKWQKLYKEVYDYNYHKIR